VVFDPQSTGLIVVDPQVGFTDLSGSFGRAFGAGELSPIQAAVRELAEFIAHLPEQVGGIVVTSEYQPGYHTKGDLNHPLASLCVAAGPDCELSSGFTVRPGWTRVIKHEIDAASSHEFLETLEVWVRDGRTTLLVAGFTATTCVKQTVLSLLRWSRLRPASIVIVQDLVGARISHHQAEGTEPSSLEKAYRAMASCGASILPSWRSIRWKMIGDNGIV
jgi:nicotinamidase-related amidase